MANHYQGKVVWITGASSGIGQALAVQFAKQGARVVLSARNDNDLQAVKEQCLAVNGRSQDYLVLPLDITKENTIAHSVECVKEWGGEINVLINNAGISQRSSCVNTSMKSYRAIMEVNVFGQIALTKAVLPTMIDQQSGHIAATSSVSGKIGVPFRTGYCAAKHAVMGFFDALRTEVQHHGINVSTIVPGYIRTPISSRAISADGETYGHEDAEVRGGMDVSKCAEKIMRGLAKGSHEIPVGTGKEMHALWLKRFFPSILFSLAAKQYRKMMKNNDIQ